MATYTYKEVTDALEAAGFVEVKNNNGSHQKFVNKKVGLSQPVPSHGKTLKTGTAESILRHAVFAAYVSNTNIASDKYKLSSNVIAFIKKCHLEMKENKMNIIPETTRTSLGIETNEQAGQFVKELKDRVKHNIPNKDAELGN